jgi:CheY-like chemotaxis protein
MQVSTQTSLDPQLLAIAPPQIALINWQNDHNTRSIEQLLDRHITTIVMTTFDRYDAMRSKFGDRIHYLFKPIKPSRLVSLIQELWHPSQPLALPAAPTTQFSAVLPRDNSKPSQVQILLAEDNHINQKVALRQLAKLGYQADIANNGQEVLEKLAIKSYDLILMDCHMPILDGYATTTAIRQLPEQSRQQTIIVALTASAMQSDCEQALAVGMNDFLSKPVQIEQLQQTIEQWLRK